MLSLTQIYLLNFSTDTNVSSIMETTNFLNYFVWLLNHTKVFQWSNFHNRPHDVPRILRSEQLVNIKFIQLECHVSVAMSIPNVLPTPRWIFMFRSKWNEARVKYGRRFRINRGGICLLPNWDGNCYEIDNKTSFIL